MQTQAAPAPQTIENTMLFHRTWPAAIIILGLVLNVAWVALLGYGLVKVIMNAF